MPPLRFLSPRSPVITLPRLVNGCALLVLLMLALVSSAQAAVSVPTIEAWTQLPAHPRLFANNARWEQLSQQVKSDVTAGKMFALIRTRAEGVLTAPSIEYVDQGSFLHGPMRQVQGRIAGLALTFRLTGDRRFLDRARREMTELAQQPSWYPQHFLDTGEAALGMAIGLDWLNDELTPTERDLFARALIEKALRPSLQPEFNRGWITSRNNWNPVCHGGLAIAALVVAEREPALARQIVERSIANVSYAAEIYAPAGAYSEGPGYWAYGTTFYALLADALQGAFGTSCGIDQAPGYLATADYVRQMTAPTGEMFNFADSIPEFGFEPVMFWFARKLHRRDLADVQLPGLDAMKDYLISDHPRHDGSRLQPLALIWWEPGLRAGRATPLPLAWWSEGGPQPQAVMRSAWNDRRATFIGMKAGKVFDSHAHMDIGSFILESDGVRWAVDLGRDSYPLARANGIGRDLFNNSQTSKRWTIFRAGPDSHNILRFDGALQDVNAKAEMRPAKNLPPGAPGFVMDLSPVYPGQVARVQRGIQLRADRSVLIQDEWQTADREAVATWQWLTRADVTIAAEVITLRQDGETLSLRVQGPTGLTIVCEDVSQPRHAFDSPNQGLSKITITLKTPANSPARLVVVARPGNSSAAIALNPVPLGEW